MNEQAARRLYTALGFDKDETWDEACQKARSWGLGGHLSPRQQYCVRATSDTPSSPYPPQQPKGEA